MERLQNKNESIIIMVSSLLLLNILYAIDYAIMHNYNIFDTKTSPIQFYTQGHPKKEDLSDLAHFWERNYQNCQNYHYCREHHRAFPLSDIVLV